MRDITVNENDGGQRLDKFLCKALPGMPASLVYKSVRKGRVRINGKKITDCSCKILKDDVLSLYINDEFFVPCQTRHLFFSAPPIVSVVYEDENILLVNKEAGLAVHDFDGAGADTLINRILHYLYDKGEYNPENELSFIPSLCNRIDRNTCGIVIAAKNAAALRIMNEKIKERRVIKKYRCLCRGRLPEESGELVSYLCKLENKNTVLVSDRPLPSYKTAITLYRVLKYNGEFSLLELTLKTGRTHQIRAQLSHIGCPLLGDGKYGKTYAQDKALGFPYQALCSYYVGFDFKDADELSYLDKKCFSINDIWFMDKI